ncbi:uncharacterized protein F4807DRAFT_465609 [Annulohypoxylon truncatum]|uniref:uncharacterized protein n=1 Tax=Annulohypoxylon truncatum TaxID=327061 RepID=UPI002007ED1E|nr:uncharacterized protein F4807DRAFT_465609 [Annulohypoxylon truncatum]KAI1204489.1 hypothetical protein F4807DRAFT_465609 [Annulohypoxylon truncatum]
MVLSIREDKQGLRAQCDASGSMMNCAVSLSRFLSTSGFYKDYLLVVIDAPGLPRSERLDMGVILLELVSFSSHNEDSSWLFTCHVANRQLLADCRPRSPPAWEHMIRRSKRPTPYV